MKIVLTATRIKKQSQIYEIFTVHPKNYSLLRDDSRAIAFELWRARNEIAIHKFFPLYDIQYYSDKIIYIYNFIEIDNIISVQNLETKEIKYSPMLGKKKCTNCMFYKNTMCTHKSKTIEKKMYKCYFWKERNETVGAHVYNGERSRTHQTIA